MQSDRETHRYSTSVQKDVSYTLAEFSSLVLTFRWIISARWDCQSGWKDSQVSVTVGVTHSGITQLRLMNLIRLSSLRVDNLSKDCKRHLWPKQKLGSRKAVVSELYDCGVGQYDWQVKRPIMVCFVQWAYSFMSPSMTTTLIIVQQWISWQNIRPATSSKLVWTEAMS